MVFKKIEKEILLFFPLPLFALLAQGIARLLLSLPPPHGPATPGPVLSPFLSSQSGASPASAVACSVARLQPFSLADRLAPLPLMPTGGPDLSAPSPTSSLLWHGLCCGGHVCVRHDSSWWHVPHAASLLYTEPSRPCHPHLALIQPQHRPMS